MRHYETFYLLRPDLNEEERAAISGKFEQIITGRGGKIVKIDPWPIQKLAYKVENHAQGYYVVMEYGAPPNAIADLTLDLRLDERVLKFMTSVIKEAFDPEAAAALQEQPAATPPPADGEAAGSAQSETSSREE